MSKKATWIVSAIAIGLTAVGAITWKFSVNRPASRQWTALLPTSKTLDGRSIEFSLSRNRIVILNFWASWCPPCMEEMPGLLRTVQSRPDVFLLAINEDSTPQDARQFLSLFPAASTKTSANAIFIDDSKREWSSFFGVDRFPETFVYTKDGKLVRRFQGRLDFKSDEFAAFVDGIIKKQTD